MFTFCVFVFVIMRAYLCELDARACLCLRWQVVLGSLYQDGIYHGLSTKNRLLDILLIYISLVMSCERCARICIQANIMLIMREILMPMCGMVLVAAVAAAYPLLSLFTYLTD